MPATFTIRTMTPAGVYGASYDVEAETGWAALDAAEPLAEADGYEVVDGIDRSADRGGVEYVLVVA